MSQPTAPDQPEQTPPPEQPGGDPWLTAKLAAIYLLATRERVLYKLTQAAFAKLTAFVRGRLFRHAGGKVVAIDPSVIFSAGPMWRREVDTIVAKGVKPVLELAYRKAHEQRFDSQFHGDFDQIDFTRAYVADVSNRLVNVTDELFNLVRAEVDKGLVDGDDIPTIAARIEETLLAGDAAVWPRRGTVIARTEVVGASNAGAWEIYKTAPRGAFDKVWLATHDHRTRPTHQAWLPGHDGLGRRPVHEPFVVGGFPAMHPGDVTLPPQEVIQCRCTALYVLAGEEPI